MVRNSSTAFLLDYTNILVLLGILPRDGKNILFKDMAAKMHTTFNFAPSYCYFVTNAAAQMLKRNYGKDTFDLADLNLHSDQGGIEYDASVTRKFHFHNKSDILDNDARYIFLPLGEDRAFQPDQEKPYLPFIEELLASATGKDKAGNPLLTAKDVAAYYAKRRVDAKASNPGFTLDLAHKIFGSTK